MKLSVVDNFTDEQRREIIRLYVDEGLSLPVIGERYFCCGSTIRRVLLLDGVTLRRPGGRPGVRKVTNVTQEQIDQCVELYRSGLSATEVGEQLDVHPGTVRYRLRLGGVSPRPPVEAQRLRYRSRLARHGRAALNDRQLTTLRFVEDAPTTSRQVARLLRTSTQTARETLDQLANYGLVSKKPSRHHGRTYRWKRTDLPVIDVLHGAMTPAPHRRSGDVWLSIEPFRDWLERLVRIEQGKDPAIPSGQVRGNGRSAEDPGAAAVCIRLGLNDRRLYAYRFEQQSVTLSAADSVLLRAGDGTRLEDLWPELGSDSEVVHLPRSYQQRVEMEASELPAAA